MCGRFALFSPPEALRRIFDAREPGFEIRPSWNVAPGQLIPVVVARGGGRHFRLCHWGLVPFWARDAAIGARMINARAETLSAKPAFKAALKTRRCLIPADGFYEWKGKAGNKQPYYFHARSGGPVAFAGLHETWEGPDASPGQGPYRSCAIITTEAGGAVRDVHHRMPVILEPAAWAEWLDPDVRDPDRVVRILEEHHVSDLAHYPVSKRVNNAARDSSECLEPVEEGLQAPGAAPAAERTREGRRDGRAE